MPDKIEFLTDEQCDEFRRLPGPFNVMVRAIYLAGYNHGIADARAEKEEAWAIADSIKLSAGD